MPFHAGCNSPPTVRRRSVPGETGAPADPLPFTPYEPTPDWTALPRPAPEPSMVEFRRTSRRSEDEAADDPKITRLNPFPARAGDEFARRRLEILQTELTERV